MKLLLFLQPMSSLPCGGLEQLIRRMRKSGWRQQTTARQIWDFVGLPCKSWFGRKSILFWMPSLRDFLPPLPAPASQGRETNCKHAQGITEKENGHLRGRFAVFPSAEARGCCGLFVVVVLAVDVAAVITLEGVAAAAFAGTEDTAPIVGAVSVAVFVSIFDGVE